jgi:hypothetical protein
MGTSPQYTTAIGFGSYINDDYVIQLIDTANGSVVATTYASWLWLAQLRARKLVRLARKGIFLRV